MARRDIKNIVSKARITFSRVEVLEARMEALEASYDALDAHWGGALKRLTEK